MLVLQIKHKIFHARHDLIPFLNWLDVDGAHSLPTIFAKLGREMASDETASAAYNCEFVFHKMFVKCDSSETLLAMCVRLVHGLTKASFIEVVPRFENGLRNLWR